MSLKIYRNASEKRQWSRVGIYGDPKTGKTRLATSLPDSYGKMAYIAADPGTEDMDRSPILPAYRDRIILAASESATVNGKIKQVDPLEEAIEAAAMDWKQIDPEINTIVWDTMTRTSVDLLEAIAAMSLYGNNIAVGKRGTNSFIAQPQQGDFGAAQRSTMHVLNFLFNQPLHVIVLFHAILTDPADGEVVGGPATVGKAMIRPVAGLFDNLFRVATKKVRIGTGSPPVFDYKRTVYTEPRGPWMAGIRMNIAKNPIAEVELEDDPINFWRALDRKE